MSPHDPARARVRRTLRPLGVLYGLGVRLRGAAYQAGWLQRRRLPVPVISVGNLTVGGTGKTPIVIWIVQSLLAAGHRVAVLSRGYRRQGRSPRLLVSDGRDVLVPVTLAGDEPTLIAERCVGAVVAVGVDRYETGRWLLSQLSVDCFVLDDGFQHWALERDLDLVLVDGSDPTGLQALLPAGGLREPLAAVTRADAVLLTRADSSAMQEVLDRLDPCLSPGQPTIRVRFGLERVIELETGKMYDPAVVAGRSAVAFSGIANPESFHALLDRQGIKLVGHLAFRDHHHYESRDLARIRSLALDRRADIICTTEKDAVKVAPLLERGEPQPPVVAMRLGCDIIGGRDVLERLLLGTVSRGVS